MRFPNFLLVFIYIRKCEKKMMKKYDLVFTIECLSEGIANSVKKDMEKVLKKLYRDIIVKSKTIEHPTFEGFLNLQENLHVINLKEFKKGIKRDNSMRKVKENIKEAIITIIQVEQTKYDGMSEVSNCLSGIIQNIKDLI